MPRFRLPVESDLREPHPVWPEAPRWCGQRALPLYRHVPGLNPHPVRDPRGHSFGQIAPTEHLPPERWRENEPYLYGVDLYHHGFLWEAHETWEGLWRLAGRDTPEGRFLQGLIQNSAALLKRHMGVARGAARLSRDARAHLAFVQASGVADASGQFMGVGLPGLIAQIDRYYGGLWRGPENTNRLAETPPRLILSFMV